MTAYDKLIQHLPPALISVTPEIAFFDPMQKQVVQLSIVAVVMEAPRFQLLEKAFVAGVIVEIAHDNQIGFGSYGKQAIGFTFKQCNSIYTCRFAFSFALAPRGEVAHKHIERIA